MTNMHVICFGVCYQHRGVKVGEGGLGGGVDVIWKQSPPVSSEKWQQSTTAPCDQIQSICLVLCSGKLRASFSDGSYNIIIPRKDLSQIHRFLSEITVLEFFIYLFFYPFLHGWDLNLLFYLITVISGLCSGKPPLVAVFLEESKQELISVSRPPDSSTCQVWRSSLPYYWLDPAVLWLCDWMLWLSSSHLLPHTLRLSQPPFTNTSL